jgi:Glutathione S-transferase N-terminal domain
LPIATRPVHPATVIILHTMPGTPDLESISPFCMKVEVHLKLQQVPYHAKMGDPRKAPKGKMPVIGDGTAKIPDSS